MSNKFHLNLWSILLGLVFIVSSGAAGYYRWQTGQIKAGFPPPTGAVSLADDKDFGVTIDLTQYDEVALQAVLDELQAVRLTWIRQPVRWAEIEPEPSQFNWQGYDAAIEFATLRGFQVIAVLETSPAWARGAETSPQTPPQEVTHFGDFAQAVARRYRGRIKHYQIWNEPNLSRQWGGNPVDPAQYVQLLKNAALNIRGIDPEANILSAALAPTLEETPWNQNDLAYLEAMYQAGAAPWFDILGAQLLGFHLWVQVEELDPQVLNIHRGQLYRRQMEAQGEGHKPIWATAFGWHALPDDWAGRPSPWPTDDPAEQRRRTLDGIEYARANWPWLGPMLGVRWDEAGLAPDDPTQGFAIKPEMLSVYKTVQFKPMTATPGNYPATHPSGQYSPGWRLIGGEADVPPPDTAPNNATPEPATLTIPFEGTRLDLILNRGAYRGYLRVTIDGAPSAILSSDEAGRSYVVLYDPLRQSDSVTIARYLSDEAHTAVIQPDGGWGQWPLSGWRVHREADTRAVDGRVSLALALALVSAGGLAWQIARQWPAIWDGLLSLWGWLTVRYQRLGFPGQVAITALLALGFYLPPGLPALLILPLLALAIALRLETGLLLISFSISFFLARKSLPVGGPSILELGLILLMLGTAFRLILALIQRERQILDPKLWLRATDGAALALLALATLVTFTAYNFGVSMFELRIVVAGSVSFYLLLRLIPWLENSNRESLARHLVDAFAVGAVLHAGLALYQYGLNPEQTITAEGVRRAIGYLYGSPNNLSLFLDRAFPMLLAMLFFRTGHRRQISYAIGLLIVTVALVLTFSKGALLIAMPVTILFFALIRGGKTAWLGAGSLLIMLSLALFPISRTERFQSTFSLRPGSTAFFRLRVWESGWAMLRDHPFTGVGLDNFLYQYRTRYILPSAWQEPNLSHPHNLFLDFGTRLGLGGILILFWLLAQFWFSAIQTYRRLPSGVTKAIILGLMGSMLTFLTHGLIDNSYFLVDLAYTFFLTIGLVEMLSAQPYSSKMNPV